MDPEGTRQHLGPLDYEYIAPIGYSNSSRCGYCGADGNSETKRLSYYASASSISPAFYQDLLNRSWRRSGKLLYRPDQKKSCCPHYTIRLDSNEFKPSKAQRQTVNRFNKHVIGIEYAYQAARRYPKSREEAKRRNNEFVLVDRIHEAEYSSLRTPPEPAHKLVVSLESDEFTEEKYEVYDNYQKTVHHDPPEDRTRRSFQRFLCSSPLRRQTITGPDGKKRQLGSYHQCYRLDGKLVAIGVLDLLPDCVSSVYFLYDESFHQFAPGKLGALYEIALAHEAGYRWWYPGFYIHNCPKMRYKIEYSPQYILDPESLKWDPLDKRILGLLDKQPFVSLYLENKKAAEQPNATGSSESAGTQQIDSGEGVLETSGEDEELDEDDRFLFHAQMPGVASLQEVGALDMDHIALRGNKSGPLYECSDLVGWETTTISEWPGIKASVAELVAALGVDCVDILCVDLVRGES